MTRVQLTLKNVRARPVVVPLRRPVVSKVGLFRDWPMILIDLYTNEGVVGHSYLEPYLKQIDERVCLVCRMVPFARGTLPTWAFINKCSAVQKRPTNRA